TDLRCVSRQAVEVRAALGGERLQPIQAAGGFKRFGVQLDGCMRREHTSATTGVLFGMTRMRSAVRAQEESRIVTGGRVHQRLPVVLALEHRQAIVVRTNAALEDGVSIQQ